MTQFTPADEILHGRPEWANPAVAVDFSKDGSRLLVARSEAELAEMIGCESLEKIRRSHVTIEGLDGSRPPGAALAIFAPARDEIHLAPDFDRLVHGLNSWHGFEELMQDSEDGPEKIRILSEKLHEKEGWTVVLAGEDDLLFPCNPEDTPSL